jgi:transcriptional regulator with AAA-type ATPase domain
MVYIPCMAVVHLLYTFRKIFHMTLFRPGQRQFAQAVADLSYCNPFLPERIELERAALGEAFKETSAVWSKQTEWQQERPNVTRINERTEQLVAEVNQRLGGSERAGLADLDLYEDLVNYLLYQRYRRQLTALIDESLKGRSKSPEVSFWTAFWSDYERLLTVRGRRKPQSADAAHLLACFFQVRRAFAHIFDSIVGGSLPAAQLRAAVWQSLFTHDMRYCRRSLYSRMGDFTTLIRGPSGTGKELVARAIGLSRFIPFDPGKQRFAEDLAGSFHPLNLSALSPTLIESELFGHHRGAFTGAVSDRVGWLEMCPPLGAVFLDEIGELDSGIQVKLLRVLQTRTFQRLGETVDRHFHGKLIAATNQDLVAKIEDGSFREDFYYRLCSDMITTPKLREQLDDCPDDLGNLVRFLIKRIAGEDGESLAVNIERWIHEHLGSSYVWPGNVRELEQCVRNLMVRRHYEPRASSKLSRSTAREHMAADFLAGSLTADELLSRYCTLMYSKTGSYEQASRQLKLDRRTVKSKIDAELLARL